MKLNQQGRQTTDETNSPNINASGMNVAAQTVKSVSAGSIPLLEKLNSFSGAMVEQGTKQMVVNAKEKAVTDVENGGFEEFGLVDDGSVYGMAYDTAGKTAFISSTNRDTQAQAKLIAAQNKYNPDGFDKSWEKYKNTVRSSSKSISPYVEAVTGDTVDQYGTAAKATIVSTLATKKFEMQQKDNTDALAMYDQEFINAKLNGDENAAATALINRNNTLRSMMGTYQITERGIGVSNKLFMKKVISEQVKSNFAAADASGQGALFISEFREMASKSAEFKNFSPDEIDTMVTGMYKKVKEKFSYDDAVIAQEDAAKEKMSEEIKQTFNEAWVGGTLTEDMVDKALEDDYITLAEHKNYVEKVYDKGDKFTDSAVELKLVQNFASLNVNDILTVKGLTNEDRMKYITKLRTYKESEEGKWTSTVQGKAALQMLRNTFNISQAGMLAKITKEGDVKSYAKVYQAFIMEMEKLSADQREYRAMHYAQASLDQNALAVSEDRTETDAKEAVVIQRSLQKRSQSYQKRVGKNKSQFYYDALAAFSDDFGTTGDIKFNRVKWE